MSAPNLNVNVDGRSNPNNTCSSFARRRLANRVLFRLSRVILAAMAVALVLTVVRFWPRPPLAARIPSSTAVVAADGSLLRLTMARDQQYRLWTPLERVSPEFVDALLLHEDQHFYAHAGVNPIALVRAASATYSGGMRQGGSTITMQLARLLYGLNTRTVSGKLKQIALAVGLEFRYSKHDLLEAHINLLPYGGDVQGIGAASEIYFGKTPSQLALNEALTLVLIPQAPSTRSPLAAREPASLTAARRRLFAQWQASHPQASDQAGLIALPLHYNSSKELPFEAPHFTGLILGSRVRNTPTIQTTLDLNQQHLVERILQGYIREQRRLGVQNAAALLVDTRDMGVRAMVGSARFSDESISGQVNGTTAKRSPGSALKPFIYALGIDQGLIHPLTMLKDAPASFGAYSPENFDGRFVGPISATEALVRSRNVPAVALSARLAQPNFYQFLRDAGIAHMASEHHYGLSLALGGGEVTMEETAALYAMLANGGMLHPLRHRVADRETVGTQLLSEQAAFLTTAMLQENPRPDAQTVRTRGNLHVAWKTGTSWGFRDAWTAGIFGHYVLVIWVGNFDSTSNPAFVGIQSAAPLFFRIFDALHAAEPTMSDLTLRPPPGVTQVAVCAASGDLPNAECPQTALTWFIPGKSPIRISDVHRRIWYDTRTGEQACPPYDPEFVRSEVFEFWPSDVLRLFAEAGMPRRQPPAPASCQQNATVGLAPHINSPLSNTTYTLRAARVGNETIPLAATTDGDVRTVHWFVDDAYVGTSRPDVAVSWTPGRSGEFTVRAVDDQGRADSRALRVAVVP
jgi:penicillin-binding protein 1C